MALTPLTQSMHQLTINTLSGGCVINNAIDKIEIYKFNRS